MPAICGFFYGVRKMPLPNILEFIGTNISQRKFQEAQEKLLNYLGIEVPTKTELAVKADKTYVDNALTAIAGGHKAYQTLAAAQAAQATLPANTVVEVTNDPTSSNNGTYQWNGTALTKSPYDPLTQAKTYTDAKATDITKSIDIYQDVPLSDFTAGSDSLGLPVTTDLFYKSPSYIYIPGSTITFSRLSTDVLRFGYQFSDDGIKFNDPNIQFHQTLTVSNPTAKYVRFYVRHSTTGTPLTQANVLSSGLKFVLNNYKINQNRLSLYRQTSVFDSHKITAKDFELGDDDALGAIAATNQVKTKPYYLKDGGVVTLTGSAVGFAFRIAVSDNPNTGFGTKQSFTNGTFTVTADKPYFKIYVFAGSFNYDAFKASSGFYLTTSLDLSRYQFDLIDKIGREDFYNLNEFRKFKVSESDFKRSTYALGSIRETLNVLQTKSFKVKAGDNIAVSCPATNPKFLWVHGTGETPVISTEAKAGAWYTETSFTFNIPDGKNYVAFGIQKQDGSAITDAELALLKFTAVLNKTVDEEKFETASNALAAKKLLTLTQDDFQFGEEDNISYLTSRNLRHKLVYKLPVGAIANLKFIVAATHTPLIFGATQSDGYYKVAKGPNPSIEMTSLSNWRLTSSADKQYFKIYVGTKDTSLMTIEQFNALRFTLKVEMLDEVAKQSDISDLIYQQNRNQRGVTRFLESGASTYRTPSLAQGGVISFIDDDFRDETFTELYPVIKSQNVPYGIAVIPSFVNSGDTNEYGNSDQIFEMSGNYNVEIMSHTYTHTGMSGSTPEQQHETLRRAKEWFIKQGIYVKSFVYPYGQDSSISHGIVNQYYESAYDFGADVIENFDSIRNYTIQRYTFNWDSDMAVLKAAIDQAHATNGWIIFTTHAGLSNYWDSTMPAKLVEIVQYARSAGCKLLKPSDAFQVYGNILESDSGFKITAGGKIVGAS